jgi:pyruvate formate lyase activating enzyme
LPITIKGFIKNTLLDWDGKVASMVFTPGCNFRCPFCHSPQLVSGAEELQSVPPETVVSFILDNRDWVDGLVISGGEPTLQPHLIEFLETLRREDIPAKLDTNGSRPDVLKEVLRRGFVQYVAMDVKAPPEKYAETCGVEIDPQIIERSIRLLIDGNVDYEFRTTVCPPLLGAADIAAIARWIHGAKRYFLQHFRGGACLDDEFDEVIPMPEEQIESCARAAAEHVQHCFVRGRRPDVPAEQNAKTVI